MNSNETNLCDVYGSKYQSVRSLEQNHNKQHCPPLKKEVPWKEQCYQFTQETTLHGLKYISLRETFVLRRIFWFVLTIVCCAIMSYQIIDRIIYYYSSPITVNVKVNYNRSLVFPSVTVCNQNAFKSSAAAENNWYRVIETMYSNSPDALNESFWDTLDAKDLKLSDLFIKTGHRKEDLIVGCKWIGSDCTHEDFQPILTDHGLCYTFKPRQKKDQIVVSSTGSDQGLKLLLNVEQYEYMPGPNDAAGVKVLTYDESDIPRIKELGISIPTDIHAFVGLQLLVIKNLHKPEGKCEEMDLKYSHHYSTDACLIECLNKLTENECGCRSYFIPSSTDGVEECTVQKYFSCYKKYYDKIQTLQEQCTCPTACHYSVFDPTVSYASTSEYSAEQKLAKVSTSSLHKKVLNAREVSHRLEEEKFDLFKKLIFNFKTSFENVITVLRHILLDISVHLSLIRRRYMEDKKAWSRKTYLFKYQIYNVEKNFIRARDAMEERTLSNLCVGFYEFVFMVETNLQHLASEGLDDTARFIIYTKTLDSIQSQVETAERAMANVSQLYDAYQNGTPIFRYKFGKSLRKHNIHIVPKALLAESLIHNGYARRYAPRLQEDIAKIQSDLYRYKVLLDQVNSTRILNFAFMKNVSGNYIDSCEDFYHSKSVFYAECVQRPKVILTEAYEKFKQLVSNYMETMKFLEGNLHNLESSVSKLTEHEIQDINQSIDMLTSYLRENSNTTKDHLADIVLSKSIFSHLSHFEAIFREIRNRGQNVFDGWTELMSRVSDVWNVIINDERMKDYYHYRNYQSFLVNFTSFINATNSEITEIRNRNVLHLAIHGIDKNLMQDFNALKGHLTLFKRSTQVDAAFLKDNFLRTDVFYRQLSYEEIDQQVAYDIFGLLCDIGGSMGLFIGASVMTIFEILDFVLNLSAEKVVRQRNYRQKRRFSS